METACGGRCNNVLDHSLRILQHPPAYTGLGLSRGASRRCRSKAYKKVMRFLTPLWSYALLEDVSSECLVL